MTSRFLLAAIMAALPFAALAQTAPPSPSRNPNWIAIGMFMMIVVTTLVITYRSAGRTRSKIRFLNGGSWDHAAPERLGHRRRFPVRRRILEHFRDCGHERI
jgi:hypothetical protein